jgi:two-component system chemotaxis response regulator CheY
MLSGDITHSIFNPLLHEEEQRTLLKVLVVDNAEEIRNLLQLMLTSRNFEVELADSGELALQKYRAFKPDVVTLDLGMPGGMSGYEALTRLIELDRNANVIIITAYPYDHSLQECLKRGAGGYITKPFTVDEVVRTIRQASIHTRF